VPRRKKGKSQKVWSPAISLFLVLALFLAGVAWAEEKQTANEAKAEKAAVQEQAGQDLVGVREEILAE